MNYSQCFCCWDEADGHSILLFFHAPFCFPQLASVSPMIYEFFLVMFWSLGKNNEESPMNFSFFLVMLWYNIVEFFGKKGMKNLQWICPISLWCCGILLLNFWEKINEESPMNFSYFLVMLWYIIVEFLGKKTMKNLQWICPVSLWCCGIILLNYENAMKNVQTCS